MCAAKSLLEPMAATPRLCALLSLPVMMMSVAPEACVCGSFFSSFFRDFLQLLVLLLLLLRHQVDDM